VKKLLGRAGFLCISRLYDDAEHSATPLGSKTRLACEGYVAPCNVKNHSFGGCEAPHPGVRCVCYVQQSEDKVRLTAPAKGEGDERYDP
jgi:hypothetical protein